MTTKVYECWYDLRIKGQGQIYKMYLKAVCMARIANSFYNFGWRWLTFCTMIAYGVEMNEQFRIANMTLS